VTDTRLPHRAGIDGLRALAVTAVLLYHAEISWLPGGFLGVDVFFAISGYLIASLLMAETTATGAVSLRGFWRRRARRLLPAVGVLLVAVTLLALLIARDAVTRLRGDVFAALTYSSNWWQIIRGETYFETFGRPPLLRHLWSLAVEEQLYIALPLVFSFLVRRRLLRYRRLLALGAVLLAVASLLWLRVLWESDDPSRAWYGTDTRAAALLLGVAAALRWPMGARRRWTGLARTSIDVVSVASVAGLVALFATIGERDPALPAWGFAVTALLSVAAVVSITSPGSRVHRYLALRPLRWIGTRSYAIYLWHWPIFVLTRPGQDVTIDGWRLFGVRIALTAAAAELSWRIVEQPVRTGAIARTWWELGRTVRVRIAVASAGALAVLAVALGFGLAATGPDVPELLAAVAESPSSPTTLVELPRTTSTTRASSSTTSTTTTVGSSTSVSPSAPTTAAPPTTAPPPAAPPALPPGTILAVGDSVMLAARDALVSASGGSIHVDAAIGRQVDEGLAVLEQYRQNGTFAQISALVVHFGTNGVMTDDRFNRLAEITRDVPRVVVLNVRVPKSWEGQSNAAINGGAGRFAYMRLADWYAESGRPGMLAHDGVHPSHEGARVYSDITIRGLEGTPPPTTTTTAPPSTTTVPPPTSSTTAPPSSLTVPS
jgi:peptidoglycan/LPS O-acetylase OafA/YrhL